MFTKDFNLLNELYHQKVAEMNIGPLGDQGSGTGLSVDKLKETTAPSRPCPKCQACGKYVRSCEEAEEEEKCGCEEEDCESCDEETDPYATVRRRGSLAAVNIKQALTNESKESLENLLYEIITVLEKRK